jgi:hypothetical protein
MNQKSSFREVPQFVSRALTANSRNKGRVVNKLKLHGEKDNHSLQLVWWLDAA